MKDDIIAVDFDGMLCENKYPAIGKAKEDVICELLLRKEEGAKIVLWTCRTGERLRESVEWCRVRGIVFDAVNENLPEVIERYGGDTRKIAATEYWDDRAVPLPGELFFNICASGLRDKQGRGMWIYTNEGYIPMVLACSVCGGESTDEAESFDFCPFCGSPMAKGWFTRKEAEKEAEKSYGA